VPGRIEIDDVRPVVSCGRYPAKAVVGEMVPVRATVWREGHEAVAATLVVRYLGRGYPRLAGTADRMMTAGDEPRARRADSLVTVRIGRRTRVAVGRRW
jgi:starch synthase (maltosyl-transferring)